MIVAYQRSDRDGRNARRRARPDFRRRGTAPSRPSASATSPRRTSSAERPRPTPPQRARCRAGGTGAPALRARDAGAARRQLGALRRRNPAAGRSSSRDVEMTTQTRVRRPILWQNWQQRTRIDELPPDVPPRRSGGRLCGAARDRHALGAARGRLEDRRHQRRRPEAHRRRRPARRPAARQPRARRTAPPCRSTATS